MTTEVAGEGTDLVQSSVTYTLAANVDNLTLTGAAVINGTGNADAITITGNTAANTLTGRDGNDTLVGGTGADTLVGGKGDDTYAVDNVADVTTEIASQGTDLVQSSVTYTLAVNVDSLTLTGAAGINDTGNVDANILIGNTGINTLTGAGGNDTLDGGGAADNLIGGRDDDIYVVDNVGDITTEMIGEGTDLVQSSVSLALAVNIENLTVTGTGSIDGIGKTLGNVIIGNSGSNILLGLSGADTLDGDGGADTLAGGTGDDQFQYANTSDSTIALSDVITDFTAGAGGEDEIDLSGIDAKAGGADDAFAFGGLDAAVVVNSITFSLVGGNTVIQADVDGNTTADFRVVLTGDLTTTLIAADFVL